MKKIFCQTVFLVLIILLNACIPTTSSVQQSKEARPAETALPTETVRAGLSPLTSIPTSMYNRSWSMPLPNGLPREITYLSNRTGLAEIWLLDLAAGLERQLTKTDCSDSRYTGGYEPEWYVPGVQGFNWAPDGRRIAYLAACTSVGHLAQLNVYDLETNGIITITDRVDANSYPSWTPSSDSLVFSVLARGDVYIADIGGESVSEIEPSTRTFCAFPMWSPDGRYIAYRGPEVGLPGTGSRTYLSVVDQEWNHLVYDPPPKPTTPSFPDSRGEWIAAPSHDGLAWSNNSRYLAVATEREYVPGSLTLVEVNDQVARRYPSSLLGPENPFGSDFYSPVFSPDDETLYFVSTWPDAECGWPLGTIYSIQVHDLLLDNSSPDVQVISPESQLAGFPALSPDGKWLLYTVKTGEAIEVWLQAVDGTYRQRLVGDGFMNTRPAWRPLDR